MPTRKKTPKLSSLSGPEIRYFLDGTWLLLAQTHSPPGKAVWERNKRGILAIWNDPAGPGKGSLFGPEPIRGCGRTGLPCFGQIVFDGEKLPKLDRNWPPDIRKLHANIRENLRYHRTLDISIQK